MTVERERTFRGISARAAVGYLVRVGGEQIDERTVSGAGWTATVSADSAAVGPSLTISEVTVTFEGEEDVLGPVIEAFARKALRAGG